MPFSKIQSFNNEQQKQVVLNYLRKAGTELIYYKSHGDDGRFKEKWNKKRAGESVLGYENAQQLTVFPWNTPTLRTDQMARSDQCRPDWVPKP